MFYLVQNIRMCFGEIIKRFSEDIDITYDPGRKLSNKEYSRDIKKIEVSLSKRYKIEKINNERNDKNKASYVFFGKGKDEYIKLEIGASSKPHPKVLKKGIKSYIHEYLKYKEHFDDIEKYQMEEAEIYVLDMTRTFVDKLLAIRRHAYNGNIVNKARHIYDLVQLYNTNEIKEFLNNKKKFKELIKITKKSDGEYLKKRTNEIEYNPLGKFDFSRWKEKLDVNLKTRYEKLHEDILYQDYPLDFNEAMKVLLEIDNYLQDIEE